MNNKYLGTLSHMLFSPEPLGSGSGASVESPGGKEPAASPATENIYGSGDEHSATPVVDDKKPAADLNPDTAGENDRLDFTKDDEPAPGDEGGEEQELNEDGTPKVKEEPAAPQLLKLDPETIAALRQQSAPQTKQEQPKLSPQQLREILNPVEVTDEMVANMAHEDPAVRRATLQNFANAAVKNAVSIARVMIDQARKQVESTLQPIQQNIEQQSVESTRREFYGQHKDLVKYQKIVSLATQEVNPNNADGTPKTKAQVFKEVADSARATLKSYGVVLESSANPGAGSTNGGNRQVPAPNRLSGPGRSGGDNNGQKGAKNNPQADIYSR